MHVLIEKLQEIPQISKSDKVRVKSCGNITEIMYKSNQGKSRGYIQKLSAEQYLDKRTGEIKEFNHYENRASDYKSVARSLALGRDMLNTNITDVSKCRWITLTYAENMTDTERLYRDFKNFNKKCRKEFGHYEYIVASEPQGRGAWHMHCVFIFKDKAPYMENKKVAELWKQGFVKVKKLDNVDNVGAYLTAYLGDLELTDENKGLYAGEIKSVEIEQDNGKKVRKSYIKGARMKMYPAKFHIFRFSKGLKKPDITQMSYKDAKEKVCAGTQTYSKALRLSDLKNEFSETLVYEYYNSIRVKSQEQIEKITEISKDIIPGEFKNMGSGSDCDVVAVRRQQAPALTASVKNNDITQFDLEFDEQTEKEIQEQDEKYDKWIENIRDVDYYTDITQENENLL